MRQTPCATQGYCKAWMCQLHLAAQILVGAPSAHLCNNPAHERCADPEYCMQQNPAVMKHPYVTQGYVHTPPSHCLCDITTSTPSVRCLASAQTPNANTHQQLGPAGFGHPQPPADSSAHGPPTRQRWFITPLSAVYCAEQDTIWRVVLSHPLDQKTSACALCLLQATCVRASRHSRQRCPCKPQTQHQAHNAAPCSG